MEIQFPIEFLVYGTPVSAQAKEAASRNGWKARVREASLVAIPQPHFVSNKGLAVTMYYFPDEAMEGDVDNIVKLVLDALCRHIYLDDKQVERVVVQKFEPGSVTSFSNLSGVLADALTGQKPVLYIRISSEPNEDLK